MARGRFVCHGVLIKTQTETQDIGDIVRRITVGYAQYHNIQNGRTGHLFQNRFRSEAIDSDAYFLEVLRYIHRWDYMLLSLLLRDISQIH